GGPRVVGGVGGGRAQAAGQERAHEGARGAPPHDPLSGPLTPVHADLLVLGQTDGNGGVVGRVLLDEPALRRAEHGHLVAARVQLLDEHLHVHPVAAIHGEHKDLAAVYRAGFSLMYQLLTERTTVKAWPRDPSS